MTAFALPPPRLGLWSSTAMATATDSRLARPRPVRPLDRDVEREADREADRVAPCTAHRAPRPAREVELETRRNEAREVLLRRRPRVTVLTTVAG